MTPPLPTTRLGRTPFLVTRLGLGCFQFTREFAVSQAEAGRILATALQAGINFFDTAPMYGFGESEELLARAVQRHGRSGLVLSSKVGYVDRTVGRPAGEGGYVDEDVLLRMIKHTFWLLRVDVLPVLMIHEPDWPQWRIDPRTGDSVITTVLERLKQEGVIGAIGLGGWNADHMAGLVETGRFDVVLIAGGLTLLGQPMRRRLVPAVRAQGAGLIIGGVFGQGSKRLFEKDRPEAERLIATTDKPHEQAIGRRLLALYDLSDRSGVGMAELGIRYAASDPDVHVHIPGARELGHLTANLAAFAKGPLPTEVVQEIDRIGKMA